MDPVFLLRQLKGLKLVTVLVGLAATLQVPFFGALDASARELTLPEAVIFALEHSPVFDSAKKAKAIKELEHGNSFARLLPSVDFSTTLGLQNNIPISSNSSGTLTTTNPAAPWYSSLNLGLSETLYDNGASLTRLGLADLNRQLATLEERKARDSLVLEIADSFYSYSLLRALVDVRRQQQLLLEKQFKTLSSQYQQGFKTKSDYLRLKAQVQRIEIERISAENAVEQAVVALRKLLGVRAILDEALRARLAAPVQYEGELPTFAPVQVKRNDRIEKNFPQASPPLAEVYEYKSARIRDEIDDHKVSLTRREYWPRVSLDGGINYSNQNFLAGGTSFAAGNDLSWNVLLTFKYNLFDWGIRRRDLSIAEFNRDIEHNSRSREQLDISAEIAALMVDLSRIGRNHRLSDELLSLEEQTNGDLESHYREGKATYLDLITSLNSLLDAKVAFYTSYFDGLRSLAKYYYYEGKLYERIVGAK